MEKITAQAEMLSNRLRKRLRHLKKWAKRTGTGAFRLYDRDIPEIPLVLDLYGDIISGALYKRPYEKDEAEENVWLEAMRAAIARTLCIGQDNIIIKRRERQRRTEGSLTEGSLTKGSKSQYEKIAGEGLMRVITEGGLKFKVNLSDYLDTGLFLDRRVLRGAVRSDSAGKRVLNLFCYTASFSVYAAAGGAASTDSVDLSNTYLGWAKENFSLNGFKAEIARETFSKDSYRHRLVKADVTEFLRWAAAARLRWDIIILDPPAFSNSSMASADIDLRRDYGDLLQGCLALLAADGKLIFSAGARSFKATAIDIKNVLTDKFPGTNVYDQSEKFTDEDFKGRKMPRTYFVNNDIAATH